MPSATLWLVDGSRVGNAMLELGKSRLTSSEKQRFDRFKRSERQRQYLLGRMLLRFAISQVIDVPLETIGTIDRAGSAPLLCLPEGVQAPAFSLSHSGQWIACVVSIDTPLGLDIEMMDERRDVIALSETAFDQTECLFMRDRNDDEQAAAFYRIWTMKEALFKLSPALSHASLVDAHGELRTHGEGWFSSTVEHASLCMSICSTSPLTDITLLESSEFY